MELPRNLKPDNSINSEEIERINRQLHLQGTIDDFFDLVVHGKQPNFNRTNVSEDEIENSDYSSQDSLSLARQVDSFGFHVDTDVLYDIAKSNLSENELKEVLGHSYGKPEKQQSKFAATQKYGTNKEYKLTNLMQDQNLKNEEKVMQKTNPKLPALKVTMSQAKALRKYPELIDFLGRDGFADKIAKKMIAEINNIVAEKISENSKKFYKYAVLCKADRQNLKQYFVGEDWVCCVTANGIFRGDEIIYYKRDEDAAYILRRGEKSNEMINVTKQFNVIHEYQDGIPEEMLKFQHNDNQETENEQV